MASISLKQQVKGEVGESSFDESLWNSYEPFERMSDLETALRFYELLKANKRMDEELQRKDEELQRQRDEIQDLKGKGTVIFNISSAAKSKSIRDKYREKEVPAKLVSGGFVSQRLFVEFVKGARSMCKVDENDFLINDDEVERESTMLFSIQNVEESIKASGLDTFLEDSKNSSFFSEEPPQSAVACELLRKALVLLRNECDLPVHTPEIFVSHHFNILASVSEKDYKLIHGQPSQEDEQQPSNKKAKTDYKLDCKVDVLCWFNHSDDRLGACALAAAVYKPNNIDEEVRDAQADMLVSNIQNIHKKPCICIVIAGGQTVSEWNISVYGISKSLLTTESTGSRWEKSELFSGKGLNAIVRVAAGLLASAAYFPKKLYDFGNRLGPVVGYHRNDDGVGEIIKAYDNPQIRRPNIELIRQLLDPSAELWKSMDDDTNRPIYIVKMSHRENDWKGTVTFQSFIDILEKLKALHENGCVHGDVRLSNLLSSGYIVDFDFVGLEKYPEGLQTLETDGERHEEVRVAIQNETIGNLEPKAPHDHYSMAAVMRLFKSKSEIGQTCWQSARSLVQNGDLNKAIGDLSKNATERIELSNAITLSGTCRPLKSDSEYVLITK